MTSETFLHLHSATPKRHTSALRNHLAIEIKITGHSCKSLQAVVAIQSFNNGKKVSIISSINHQGCLHFVNKKWSKAHVSAVWFSAPEVDFHRLSKTFHILPHLLCRLMMNALKSIKYVHNIHRHGECFTITMCIGNIYTTGTALHGKSVNALLRCPMTIIPLQIHTTPTNISRTKQQKRIISHKPCE